MENVTKWLMKVSNSNATKKSYQQRINVFAKYMKENHNIDIEMLKDAYREAKYKGESEREKFLDRLHDVLEDYACFIKTQGYTTMNVEVTISTISSFIKKGCGIKDVEFDIPKRAFPQFHNRDITKEEIKTILEHANLRDRTFFLMMVESGLRPGTLLALRYRHVKLDFENNIVPMYIDLPSELLKDRISARWTFIGEDGFKLLREYLSTRANIQDNDLLFQAERPTRMKKGAETISESALSNKFNKLILKLGIDTTIAKRKPKSVRLYNLRKYFFNNMKCDSAYRNFWFCHSSVDDHYVSTQKDKHKEEYLKGYKFLRVFESSDVDVRLDALTNELKATKQALLDKDSYIAKMQTDFDAQQETLKQIKEYQTKLEKGMEELKIPPKEVLEEQIKETEEKLAKLEEDIKKDLRESLKEVIKEELRKELKKQESESEKP